MASSMLFDITARDRASSEFVEIAAQVDILQRKLRDLDGKRVKASVALNTPSAAKLTALNGLAASLRDIDGLNARAKVDVAGIPTAATANALRRTATALRELDGLNATARVDITGLGSLNPSEIRRAARALRELEGIGSIAIHISVTGAVDALAKVVALRQGLRALPGSTDLDVNVNASKGIAAASLVTVKMLAIGAAALYTIPLLGSLTANTASLGGALVSLAGLAPLAVGALAAAGVAAGALAVGLGNIGDALGETDTPAKLKKVQEAIASLSPSARSAVLEIRGLAPAWTSLRLDVQERLFKGLSTEIAGLAKTYLPVLKTGLGAVATEFNRAAIDVSDFMREAGTVRDIEAIFRNTGEAVAALRPSVRDLLAVFTDLGVVGTEMLPELATGWRNLTARFRDFIFEARQTGQLEEWIRGGIDTLQTLGSVAGNVGGILSSLYTAARDSGADFLSTLDRVTERMRNFLRSAEGQSSLVTFFGESRLAIDQLLPGLERLGRAAVDAISGFSRAEGLQAVADAFDSLTESVAPLLASLGRVAGETLSAIEPLAPRLLAAAIGFKFFGAAGAAAGMALATYGPLLSGLVEALGPILPLIAAGAVAFKLFGLAAAGFAVALPAVATGIAAIITLLTGFSVVGAAAAAGVTRLFAALTSTPALVAFAAAFVVISQSVQAATGDLDGWAKGMIQGGDAARKARADFEAHNAQFTEGSIAADLFAKSEAELTAEIESQIAALPPLEQAQARLAIAQTNYNDKVREFTADSPQAREAAGLLATAQDGVEAAQRRASDATKSHTDRMIEQSEFAAGAANADVAYQQSLLRIADAQDRAAEAARNHGAGSRDAAQANLDLLQANLTTADSARRLAEANAIARGESNFAEQGARAYKDELNRLADAAANRGDTSTAAALRRTADATVVQGDSANNAEGDSARLKDELGRLAGMAGGPLRDEILKARDRIDEIAGSEATAEEKTRLFKDEMNRLTGMSSGTLRPEFQRLGDSIVLIPDGNFTITGEGVVGEVKRGGGGRFATGGILPGYTPGRDVHRFVSPTGGVLDLSGGEPVMRPEFGRVVGRGWIDGANAAARRGGVAGVADFLHRAAPASRRGRGEYATGGIIGRARPGLHGRRPHQRLAFGGFVRGGTQPFGEVGRRDWLNTEEATKQAIIPLLKADIARFLAAEAGGGPLGGGSGPGGWQWQMAVLRAAFPGLALISGFRPGAITATGNPSYHGKGRAVDIPPRMDVFNWIRGNYGANTKELIFSPAGGAQLNNGRPHVYTGVTKAMHYDHVHWAYRNGGVIPDGAGGGGRPRVFDNGGLLRHGQLGLNLSGATERVLNPRETRDYDSRVNMANQLSPLRSMRDRAADNGPVVAALARLEAATAKNSRLDRLVGLLEQNGAGATITVEDRSGNPTETGRAAAMAIRRFR